MAGPTDGTCQQGDRPLHIRCGIVASARCSYCLEPPSQRLLCMVRRLRATAKYTIYIIISPILIRGYTWWTTSSRPPVMRCGPASLTAWSYSVAGVESPKPSVGVSGFRRAVVGLVLMCCVGPPACRYPGHARLRL